MYLSRLILNPRSRQVRREMADVYQMHRTIMHAFPEKLPDTERVLFRLEQNQRDGLPLLLVQSQTQPDWNWLTISEKDYLCTYAGQNPAVKLINYRLKKGQNLRFRLRANPTVKRSGKRIGLVKEEEQLVWLMRKAALSGFEVKEAQVMRLADFSGDIHRFEKTHTLKLLVVDIEGVLTILDLENFYQTLENGIGTGKGLGVGLLSIATAN